MLVFIVATAQLLVYVCAVPVNLAFRVDGADGLRFGSGLSAFDPRAALRRAMKRRRLKARGKSPAPREIWRFVRRLRLSRASLSGTIGLGDAALTALACGALTTAASALFVRTDRARVALRPDFAAPSLRIELRGMVSARAGQIMLAFLRAGFHDIEGRVRTWTNTRSKAS